MGVLFLFPRKSQDAEAEAVASLQVCCWKRPGTTGACGIGAASPLLLEDEEEADDEGGEGARVTDTELPVMGWEKISNRLSLVPVLLAVTSTGLWDVGGSSLAATLPVSSQTLLSVAGHSKGSLVLRPLPSSSGSILT